jgi:hypothetical protein
VSEQSIHKEASGEDARKIGENFGLRGLDEAVTELSVRFQDLGCEEFVESPHLVRGIEQGAHDCAMICLQRRFNGAELDRRVDETTEAFTRFLSVLVENGLLTG